MRSVSASENEREREREKAEFGRYRLFFPYFNLCAIHFKIKIEKRKLYEIANTTNLENLLLKKLSCENHFINIWIPKRIEHKI